MYERNRYRKGRWLVVDDESGEVLYSDQVVRRWDGLYVKKSQDEPIDPQWFITAQNDPKPLPFVRPDGLSPLACRTRPPYQIDGIWALGVGSLVIEQTFQVYPAVRTPARRFPGYNLYVGSSVSSMEIGCSFIVFPDNQPLPPVN